MAAGSRWLGAADGLPVLVLVAVLLQLVVTPLRLRVRRMDARAAGLGPGDDPVEHGIDPLAPATVALVQLLGVVAVWVVLVAGTSSGLAESWVSDPRPGTVLAAVLLTANAVGATLARQVSTWGAVGAPRGSALQLSRWLLAVLLAPAVVGALVVPVGVLVVVALSCLWAWAWTERWPPAPLPGLSATPPPDQE